MPADRYTADEVDAAVQRLLDASSFGHAQEIVTHAAPGLQRILSEALHEGGWFGSAHESQLTQAAAGADEAERLTAIRILAAEEARLGMLVGVAVGLRLAEELQATNTED